MAIVAAFLTPLLPFLVKGGEEAVKEVGKRFGGNVWDRAQTLWTKLRPKVESKPAALEVVQDVANNPSNKNAQAALLYQLEKLLENDSILANELAHLWEEASSTDSTAISKVIASGERAVAIGRNAIGNTIVTGDQRIDKTEPVI